MPSTLFRGGNVEAKKGKGLQQVKGSRTLLFSLEKAMKILVVIHEHCVKECNLQKKAEGGRWGGYVRGWTGE